MQSTSHPYVLVLVRIHTVIEAVAFTTVMNIIDPMTLYTQMFGLPRGHIPKDYTHSPFATIPLSIDYVISHISHATGNV